MTNTLNRETLPIMMTARVLLQSDKVICLDPFALSKDPPACHSLIRRPSIHTQLSAFHVLLNHHPLHNLRLHLPLPTPVPAKKDLFFYIHTAPGLYLLYITLYI